MVTGELLLEGSITSGGDWREALEVEVAERPAAAEELSGASG